MTYNKEAIYKYRESHPEEYKKVSMKAILKYREKNIDAIREKDRMYKRYYNETKRLRNINLF